MKEETKLSLIIPAYNEEKRIGNVVKSYSTFLDKKYNYEIIIVCDGNDCTSYIIKNMMIDNPNIRLIEYHGRQGKGMAIIRGFSESYGNVLAFVDADESVLPEEFDKLVNALEDNDCAIASRRISGAQIVIGQPWIRIIPSKIFNIIVNVMFDLGIKDTQCGAKVFKKEPIDSVLLSLKTKGFEFDVELLWRIKSKGFSIKEVPIKWVHNNGSTFNLIYSISMFLSLLRIRLRPCNI